MKSNHRLSSADFRTLRPKRRVHGTFFSLSIAESPARLKWACVVSKKVSTKAVTRNLVKRRARSVLQTRLKGAQKPFALILSAKRQAAAASFGEIRKDILGLIDSLR